MNNTCKARRKKYTAQFYKKNHATFLMALFSTLLIAALNLWIAWVMQQMIDSVSGVPGAFNLSVLALFIAGVVVSITILQRKAFRRFALRIPQITYLHFPMMPLPSKMVIWKYNLISWLMVSS